VGFSLTQWSRLHTVDAVALRRRWQSNPDPKPDERLLDAGRFDRRTKVWTVEGELEMVRLLGALQWQNPRMRLWFRGENSYFPRALPARLRVPAQQSMRTVKGINWLDSHAGKDRALRDRSPLARAAILQHYGCPTSLLDVSASYDVACAFAFARTTPRTSPHLRVYALPRNQHPVTVFDDADVVLVDLNAELPSYCARPHVQQAAFIARCEAVYRDLSGEPRASVAQATVDPLCIAHLRLHFDGGPRFFLPRRHAGALYPQAGTGCSQCGKHPDMNSDYLLHILRCYAKQFPAGKPSEFPDNRS
jgi:FRG domain